MATVHDTFVIQRDLRFAPDQVFAAWSNPQAKASWFVGPTGWQAQLRELDFRVGGHEELVGQRPDGAVSRFHARFHEIVANERIVYVYDMYNGDTRTSVSLVTIEFATRKEGTHKGGTQLVITEQGVFLEGHDDPRMREHGTRVLIDQMERSLQRPSA
jgi:uncharacterized protein YndB with AHSA1/START domain